jgi:hypothetical protein
MKYLTNIDLSKNELQNARIQNLGTAPATPVAGQTYFDTGTNHSYVFNGSGWEQASGSGGSGTVTTVSVVSTNGFAGSVSNATSTPAITISTTVTGLLKGDGTSISVASASDIPTLTSAKISDFDTQVRTSRLDQMANPTASVSLNSQKITNLGTPTLSTDAVTKAYVDAARSGLDVKDSVRVATTAAGTLASSFENGDTVDGVTLATGDRILIKDQSSGSENGIYTVNVSGAPTRATDADADAEVTGGLFVFVEEGTANADSGWVLTNNGAITVGTTALTFSQFSGAGQITAGAGLTKSGNTLDVVGTSNRITVNADSVDIAATYVGQTSITTLGTVSTGTWSATTIALDKGGTGATTASGARANLGVIGKYSALVGDNSATSIPITQGTHGLAADGTNVAFLYDASSGVQVYTDVTVNPANGTVTLTFAVAPTTNQYRVVIIG